MNSKLADAVSLLLQNWSKSVVPIQACADSYQRIHVKYFNKDSFLLICTYRLTSDLCHALAVSSTHCDWSPRSNADSSRLEMPMCEQSPCDLFASIALVHTQLCVERTAD